MKHVFSLEKLQDTCVCFGSFETVHKGHKAVIDKTVSIAQEKNLLSVAVSMFRKDRKTLTEEHEKAYLLKDVDLDYLISAEEDEHFNLTDFVEHVLVRTLSAKTVVVGKSMDYRGETLQDFIPIVSKFGIDLVTVEDVTYNGEKISIDSVRKAFNEKDFDKYEELCDHPYIVIGTVEHGKELGRTVGMPTANLSYSALKQLPEDGAYATISQLSNERFMGLTNFGRRPSVDDEDRITIETLILDFNRNIYGYRVLLEVRFFIRGVKKFNGIKEVQAQVAVDSKAAREKLKSYI